MSSRKKIKISNFHLLPPEVIEKILKYLPHRELLEAKTVCRQLNRIISKGKLITKSYKKLYAIVYVEWQVYPAKVEMLINAKKHTMPSLPNSARGTNLTIHNGTLMLIGGYDYLKQCLALKKWYLDSTL